MQRVLVVDDDCTSHLILKKMVEGMGYDCDVASNGQEAVAAAAKNNYVAILMDMFMPVLNGCDAAVCIGKMAPADQPSIVGMISIDDPASREVCMLAGMEDVLCKPVQKSVLAKILNHTLARYVKPKQEEASADPCLASSSSKTQSEMTSSEIAIPSQHIRPSRRQRAPPRRCASDSFASGSDLHAHRGRRSSTPCGRALRCSNEWICPYFMCLRQSETPDLKRRFTVPDLIPSLRVLYGHIAILTR